ncbi:hypothetical protein ACOME3_009040 [Neoechinorhynchus agilis]
MQNNDADLSMKAELSGKAIFKILSTSAPGERLEVLNDINVLVTQEKLVPFAGFVKDGLESCAREQFTPVSLHFPTSLTICLVTDFNAVDDPQQLSSNDNKSKLYFDPRSNRFFTLNFMNLTANLIPKSISTHLNAKSVLSNTALQLDDLIAQYTDRRYRGANHNVFLNSEHCLVNPLNNCWSSCWRSHWAVKEEDGVIKIEGYIKIHVHYYEPGNIQLIAQKQVHISLNKQRISDNLQLIVDSIGQHEDIYHKHIDGYNPIIFHSRLKRLRRILPITRMKIDWNSILTTKDENDLNDFPAITPSRSQQSPFLKANKNNNRPVNIFATTAAGGGGSSSSGAGVDSVTVSSTRSGAVSSASSEILTATPSKGLVK